MVEGVARRFLSRHGEPSLAIHGGLGGPSGVHLLECRIAPRLRKQPYRANRDLVSHPQLLFRRSPMGEREQARLDSWKEIAEYLGRDVRTAIRWEHERGLPVHRVPGGRRGVVFAYGSEIDRWRAGASPRPAPRSGPSRRPSPPLLPMRRLTPATRESAPTPCSRSRGSAAGSLRRLAWLGAGLAAAALLVAGAAAFRLNGRLTPGRARQPGLARVEFGPREVLARTEAGDLAWRHDLEGPLEDLSAEGFSRRYAIADLDGDGSAEVVATVPLSIGSGVLQDELICFSSTGEVRWRTRLDNRVTFQGGTFGPPWFNGRVAVYTVAGKTRIAWAQSHFTWWPGILTVLDGSGRRLSTFIQAGQIRNSRWLTFRHSRVDRRHVQRVCAASLAVLDATSAVGHAPFRPDRPTSARAAPRARRCAISCFRPPRSRPRAPSPTTSRAS